MIEVVEAGDGVVADGEGVGGRECLHVFGGKGFVVCSEFLESDVVFVEAEGDGDGDGVAGEERAGEFDFADGLSRVVPYEACVGVIGTFCNEYGGFEVGGLEGVDDEVEGEFVFVEDGDLLDEVLYGVVGSREIVVFGSVCCFFESDACDGLEEMGYFSHFSKGISLLGLLQCVTVVDGYAL
ncbi:hypothetical protein Barb4_00905 [Bacteroidales bacterium Barb4]|nr:hypothetical protein Barb4_00905 [Bacteroidales bacterium Barb4]